MFANFTKNIYNFQKAVKRIPQVGKSQSSGSLKEQRFMWDSGFSRKQSSFPERQYHISQDKLKLTESITLSLRGKRADMPVSPG